MAHNVSICFSCYLEIIFENGANFMQQTEDHDDVGVPVGRGHDVEVVVFDVREGGLVRVQKGRLGALLLLVHDEPDELVDHVGLDVAAIIPVDQHFALHVQYVNGRQNHLD